MALQPQTIPINFQLGLDTKTDPNQLSLGRFESLNNSIFDNLALVKRNGFGNLPALPSDANANYLTTFNGNLTAISSSIYALATGSQQWISKGTYLPVELSTLSLIKNSTNQSQVDAAVASNGYVCTVYTDNVTSGSSAVASYKYAVADSTTGQNIVSPTVIPTSLSSVNGAPRVFVLGNYFVIIFSATTGSASHLQFIALSVTTPSVSTSPADITTSYSPSTTGSFDAVVGNNSTLYVAWNGASASGVSIKYMTANLGLSSPTVLTTHVATIVSMTADVSSGAPVIWTAIYDSSGSTGYVMSSGPNNVLGLSATQFIASGAYANVTLTAQNGSAQLYYEATNAYSFDSGTPSNFINTRSVSSSGTLGSVTVLARSVGLASKAFLIGGAPYLLVAYQSPYQPTYFLINFSGQVIAKLAYSNGGGYVITGLPSVSVSGNSVSIPYLFKDLVTSVNKDTNVASGTQTAGIYAQTGINLVTFTLSSANIYAVELGGSLQLNGGFLWNYDGYLPVENNFFLWPDSIKVSTSTSGGNIAAQVYFYQVTYEWSDNQGNIHRSAPSIPVSITTTGSTSSNTINVPTLRLTYKTANPIKIVIYRWSTAQEVYYQVTSLSVPLLNDTTADSVAYVDKLTDATILGNSLLYTTGGIVENMGAPSFTGMDIFDTRLWGIDSEDPNLLRYSKPVEQNVPVEMSDFFSIYVSPTAAAQGNTGPMTCLAPMDDKQIIYKKNAIYYINGKGPAITGVGSQYSEPTFITSTVGTSNQKSIVMTPVGQMFQSDKGIWLLGRDLNTSYVGSDVESYNSDTVLSALAIPKTNQVRFAMSSGAVLVYDYYYKQWGTFSGVASVSAALYQDFHTFINSSGKAYQETPGIYLDGSVPVLMSFQTGWISSAGVQGYVRAYDLYLLATYKTPHKWSIGLAYDYDSSTVQLTNVTASNYSPPYGSESPYGSGTYGGKSTVEQWKVSFVRQQCQSFQITFNEYYDGSYGIPPGAGLTLSELNLLVGLKKSYPKNIPATNKA